MMKRFVPIIAGLIVSSLATAQESVQIVPPQPPVPPSAPQPPTSVHVFIAGGGYLGVVPGDVTAENAKSLGLGTQSGVVLNDVLDGTPAKDAGLQKNDVIVGWNGTTVESAAQLRKLIRQTTSDSPAHIDYIRGGSRLSADVTIGQQKTVTTTDITTTITTEINDALKDLDLSGLKNLDLSELKNLGELKNLEELKGLEGLKDLKGLQELHGFENFQNLGGNVMIVSMSGEGRTGVTLQSMTPQLAKYFGVNEGTGALVGSVNEASPAAVAGLQAGDVVTAINGQKVTSPAEASTIFTRTGEGDATVTVLRDKRELTLTLKLPKQEKIDVKSLGVPFDLFERFDGQPTIRFRYKCDKNKIDGDKEEVITPSVPSTPAPEQNQDGDAKISQLRVGDVIYTTQR